MSDVYKIQSKSGVVIRVYKDVLTFGANKPILYIGVVVNMAGKSKRFTYVLLPVIILIVVVALLGIYVYSRISKPSYDFNDNLDVTVLSVNDEDVTFRELGYYIVYVEKTFDQMARSYNPDNPADFWKTHFSAGVNSTFTDDYAKSLVRELYIYDYIMEKEAGTRGVALTDAEKSAAVKSGEEEYTKISEKGKTALGITNELVVAYFLRRKLVEKYVNQAAEEIKNNGFQGDVSAQLNYNGEFYLNQIKSRYQVKYDQKQWDNMPMGKITIN